MTGGKRFTLYFCFALGLKGGKSANNGKINGALFLDFFLLDVCIITYGCLLLLNSKRTCLARFAILNIDSVFFSSFSIYVYVTKRERESKDIR